VLEEKLKKSDMFCRFENILLTQIYTFCYFCVAQNIKYLKLIFYMFVGYVIDYMQIFFLNFFNLKNIFFDFFKQDY
jgi:hypothetical protein